MNDDQFRILLDYLGCSWSGYRKVRRGVKKRIRRHMQRLGCGHIIAYLDVLSHRPEIRHECELLMTVSISRFFRDRQMWQMLKDRWLLDILAGNHKRFRIWSAGCACGEEVYTVKIVWEHMRNYVESLPSLDILASDQNPQHIERARCGVYNSSSLREVSTEDREAYFESCRGGKQVAVRDDIKTGITWEIRNLLTEPPARRFIIIFLRNNILTYCRQEVQMSSLIQILNGLAPRGLLILGRHERLPLKTEMLVPMDECPFVYQKR